MLGNLAMPLLLNPKRRIPFSLAASHNKKSITKIPNANLYSFQVLDIRGFGIRVINILPAKSIHSSSF
jgi:hypothetical protein